MARWGIVAALAAALACGGGTSGSAEKPACVPQNCSTRGAMCGAIDDGCGNVLECGACPQGQSCGGGGSPNSCGTAACQPATCQAKGATCGFVADDCGGTLACGDCPAGQTCGGGGTPHACGAPACQKATCAEKKASCGTVADGCGGELACGDCKDGEACGIGGQPNVCAPIPPTGSVGWSHVVSTPGPDLAVGAGNDRDGNRYLLSFTQDEVGGNHGLRLEKLAKDGKLVWSEEWVARGFLAWVRHFHLAVAPLGSAYVAVSFECSAGDGCGRSVDMGGGPATDSVLVKLRPDGTFEWQRALTGTSVPSLSVNAQGTVLVARTNGTTGSGSIDAYQQDGTLLASVPTVVDAVAIDPSGNLIAAAYGVLRKYSATGKLLWSKDLSGGGSAYAVETAADGTIVVLAARSGDVTFGPSNVRSGVFVLYVLEPDARPRFARGLAWSGRPWLAVDPTGRAAVTSSGSCGDLVAETFDLSNQDLWRRFLPDQDRCWAGMYPGPAAYGADHRLFLTGMFSLNVEVGGKAYLPRGTDALGVLLDP